MTLGELRQAIGDRLRDDWEPVDRGQALAFSVAVGLLLLLKLTLRDRWIPVVDHANLVFHEAGHHIYGILGRTLELYGGTLGQLTFPTIVMLSGLWTRKPLHVAFGLVWFGENLTDIARYMASVHADVVYLVGGSEHDWENIYARWHIVDNDDLKYMRLVRLVGWLAMISAPIWLWRRHRVSPEC